MLQFKHVVLRVPWLVLKKKSFVSSYVRSSRTKQIMGRIDIPFDGSPVLSLEVNASMIKYDRKENTGPTKKVSKF